MKLGKGALLSVAPTVTAVATWQDYPWVSIAIAVTSAIWLAVILLVFVFRGGTFTVSSGRGDGRKSASVRVPGRRPSRRG